MLRPNMVARTVERKGKPRPDLRFARTVCYIENVSRMKIKRILVQSSAGPYPVIAGAGAIRRAAAEIAALGKFSSIQVVSSPKVWSAVGKAVQKGLRISDRKAVHLFSDAESAKHLRSVEEISRSLCRASADRKALIVAVGGGVVGDVVGFAAASYLRGVALVHVPTTLVAQVDSSIGGKTGVNLPEGKNLIGAFYPPRLVVTDPNFLRTLPDREFRGGLAEVIKHAVIADGQLFAQLEKDIDRILKRDRKTLALVIPRNVQIKARVVGRDEHESGLREILNFGHTFAHALESVTRYQKYLHGEAVGWGMIAAARLAATQGMLPLRDEDRVARLTARVGPLPGWPSIPTARLIDAMQADKKTRAGH